jgi:uncharacterized oligopeptide transporter (OPT) family protein
MGGRGVTASDADAELPLPNAPSVESAAAFARRLGYRANDDDLELTVRAVAIGSLFAIINGSVNMFFAFRYAGSLAQYWVILVAYPLCKATELLPRGSVLNPGPFSPKEHVIVMTMAIAGSLAGTLGLSGSMLALALDFETRLTTSTVFLWAFVAGFFGILLTAHTRSARPPPACSAKCPPTAR